VVKAYCLGEQLDLGEGEMRMISSDRDGWNNFAAEGWYVAGRDAVSAAAAMWSWACGDDDDISVMFVTALAAAA